MTESTGIGLVAAVVVAAVAATLVFRHYRTPALEASVDNAHPERAAHALFEAFAREDWSQAARYWPPALPAMDDRVKSMLGGLRIVRLEQPQKKKQPFKVRVYEGPWLPGEGDLWVPYEIQFKNGAVQKADLRLSWNGSQWQFAGGL